jgi:flagellar protein FliS
MYLGNRVSHYEHYVEGNILTASPLELVRMLYRFVIDNSGDARRCTESGDIEGRGRAVNRATGGLMELLTSLNHQQGGELSSGLAELYGYMASRLLQGHLEQNVQPFDEVVKLMTTLLQSWDHVDQQDDTHAFTSAGYGNVPEAYTPINASF